MDFARAHLEFNQLSKMDLFSKTVNSWEPLIVFAKNSLLDVWLCSKDASALGQGS